MGSWYKSNPNPEEADGGMLGKPAKPVEAQGTWDLSNIEGEVEVLQEKLTVDAWVTMNFKEAGTTKILKFRSLEETGEGQWDEKLLTAGRKPLRERDSQYKRNQRNTHTTAWSDTIEADAYAARQVNGFSWDKQFRRDSIAVKGNGEGLGPVGNWDYGDTL